MDAAPSDEDLMDTIPHRRRPPPIRGGVHYKKGRFQWSEMTTRAPHGPRLETGGIFRARTRDAMISLSPSTSTSLCGTSPSSLPRRHVEPLSRGPAPSPRGVRPRLPRHRRLYLPSPSSTACARDVQTVDLSAAQHHASACLQPHEDLSCLAVQLRLRRHTAWPARPTTPRRRFATRERRPTQSERWSTVPGSP